jgi:hypothetical protein
MLPVLFFIRSEASKNEFRDESCGDRVIDVCRQDERKYRGRYKSALCGSISIWLSRIGFLAIRHSLFMYPS